VKLGFVELMVVAVIGFAAFILIERTTRSTAHDAPHAAGPAAPPREIVAAPEPEPSEAHDPGEIEPAIPAAPEVQPPAGTPALDAGSIREALATARRDIEACGVRYHDACGLVKVRVQVAPDGSSQVSIVSTASSRLGKCTVAAIEKVRFPETADGGSFTYPFEYPCP
jgi:hypothetical protein